MSYHRPKVLVLEGLFGDTADILQEAGADAHEESPWSYQDVDDAMTFDSYDALVLTGGGDVDTKLYREKPHKQVYGVDQLRDTVEMMALNHAMVAGIPVLGICRGAQLMCVARGGKLTQHIEGHRGNDHPVHAEPKATAFRRAIGARKAEFISLHHQCVKRPGNGMMIAARAADGTPEAIESHDGKWLGVQFHPEMTAYQNGNSFGVFKWLVEAAAENRGATAKSVNFKDARRAWKHRETERKRRLTEAMTYPPTSKRRAAGTRTYIEGTKQWSEHGKNELWVCGKCDMLFDDQDLKSAHEHYVHGVGYDDDEVYTSSSSTYLSELDRY